MVVVVDGRDWKILGHPFREDRVWRKKLQGRKVQVKIGLGREEIHRRARSGEESREYASTFQNSVCSVVGPTTVLIV
jgi:hypothetical protein